MQLAEIGLYDYPNSGGSEFMWDNALAAAKHMMDMIPPYPAWYSSECDDWHQPGYWAAIRESS